MNVANGSKTEQMLEILEEFLQEAMANHDDELRFAIQFPRAAIMVLHEYYQGKLDNSM